MLDKEITEFYQNWTAKVESNKGDDLRDVYERYQDLFKIYNKLYNQLPDALIANGNPYKGRVTDSAGATDITIQYLGAINILNNFQANNLNEDIQGIARLIDQEVFYLKIRYGQRDRNADLEILQGMRSADDNIKAKAILQVIYLVRCNLVHGSKDYQEYQRLLLEPLTNLLRALVIQLYTELSK